MSKKTSEASFAKPHNESDRQGGFTLVEIMVGLAIGMIATLIIMQVLSVFETQKRVTTGVADAQTNGSIALYNIAREIQLAGYPLLPVADSPLECTNPAAVAASISPITITNDVDTGSGVTSDTITVRYGDSAMGGIPTPIIDASNPNDVRVKNNLGCKEGDIALVVSNGTCALTRVIASSDATSGVPAIITLGDTTNASVGANLACLGEWKEITYAVDKNGNLTRDDTPQVAGDDIPQVAGVVNLQAQYGISDSANSNQVTQWVDAIGIWDPKEITVANRNRIKAVRIAVVARNAKMEPGVVTAPCSSLTDAKPTGLCAWEGSPSSPAPSINLSRDANWQRYRYRVFETIIPLRNVIWAKDTL